MGKSEYHSHLRSEYWREVRRQVWRRDKGKCVVCGEPGQDIHHRDYSFKFREMDGLHTVELRCEVCHAEAHGRPHPLRTDVLLARIARLGRA